MRTIVELIGGFDSTAAALDDNRFGDSARGAFVSKLEDQIGELTLRQTRDEIRRGLAAAAIHPHVEGSGATEREPAFGGIELHGADAEIEENGIGVGGRNFSNLVELGVGRFDPLPELFQTLARFRQHFLIPIDSEHASSCRHLQERARVASEAQRCINQQRTVLGEVLIELGKQNRRVLHRV